MIHLQKRGTAEIDSLTKQMSQLPSAKRDSELADGPVGGQDGT